MKVAAKRQKISSAKTEKDFEELVAVIEVKSSVEPSKLTNIRGHFFFENVYSCTGITTFVLNGL